MSFAAIAVGVGLVATAGAAAYGTSTQAGIANSQLSLAQDQQSKQDQAWQYLNGLLANPAQFLNSPIFQSTLTTGSQQVAKANAAAFGPNSTNEAAAINQYGMSTASSQLLSQEQLLAGMSGTGYNPTSALSGGSAATTSATSSLNSLAGLAAFFGTSGILSSGSASTPLAGGGYGT